jgi:hypothetical protein
MSCGMVWYVRLSRRLVGRTGVPLEEVVTRFVMSRHTTFPPQLVTYVYDLFIMKR